MAGNCTQPLFSAKCISSSRYTNRFPCSATFPYTVSVIGNAKTTATNPHHQNHLRHIRVLQ